MLSSEELGFKSLPAPLTKDAANDSIGVDFHPEGSLLGSSPAPRPLLAAWFLLGRFCSHARSNRGSSAIALISQQLKPEPPLEKSIGQREGKVRSARQQDNGRCRTGIPVQFQSRSRAATATCLTRPPRRLDSRRIRGDPTACVSPQFRHCEHSPCRPSRDPRRRATQRPTRQETAGISAR